MIKNLFSEKKTLVINLSLFIIVGLLALTGGTVFVILEKDASEIAWNDRKQSTVNCTAEYLASYPIFNPKGKALEIFEKCVIDLVPKTPWGTVEASIFSFAAITTIG